jgi:hypothetical protein
VGPDNVLRDTRTRAILGDGYLRGKLVWALLPTVILAIGCERRGGEVRPEPITLSRETPRKQGAEHGQDPRRAPEPAAPVAKESPDAAEVYDDAGEEPESETADDEATDSRKRRSAKHKGEGRKRTGGVRDGGDDKRAASTTLHAKRLIVAKKVDGREPVGVARSFDGSAVGQVAAFVELSNDAREATRIVMRFEPPSSPSFDVPLEVGAAPRWRTWATTKRPLEEGTWRVRVLDEDGALVAQTTFEVTE